MGFGGKPPSPPKPVDKAAEQAAAEAAARLRRGRGYASTVIGSLQSGSAPKTTLGE
jgi:hypothetical protein